MSDFISNPFLPPTAQPAPAGAQLLPANAMSTPPAPIAEPRTEVIPSPGGAFDLATATPVRPIASSAYGVVTANAGENTGAALKAAAIGTQIGAPQAVVEADLPRFEAQAKAQQNAQILDGSPKLANWVAQNPDTARAAQDDMAGMADIERIVSGQIWGAAKPYLTGLLKGAANGFNSASLGLNRMLGFGAQGVDAAIGTHLSDLWYQHMIAPGLANRDALAVPDNAPFGVKAADTVGNMLSMLAQIGLTGGGSAAMAEGAQAATTVTGAVGQAVAHGSRAMAFPALTSAVNTGQDVFDQTGDMQRAVRAAQMSYATTTLGGVIPLGAEGGLLTRLASGAVSGVATGEVSRQAMNLVMPQQAGFDPEQTILSGLSGAMLSGVLGRNPLHDGVQRAYADSLAAETAARGGAAVEQVGQIAQASKLREYAPQAFSEFVRQASEDGPISSVYVDGRTLSDALNQSGVRADQIPGLAPQLDEAVATGGDVQIPLEDYATHIAGTPLDAKVLPELKTEVGGMTYAEGQRFYQDAETEMQARAQDIAVQQEQAAAPLNGVDAIRDRLLEQMRETGRYPDDVARASVAPVTEFYRTMADRLGMTPGDLFEQHPMHIDGKSGLGESFGDADARGAYTPATRTVELMKDADLSTFLHESGHFFLHTMGDLAAREDAPQQLRDDMDTVLRWMDVGGAEPVKPGFVRMYHGGDDYTGGARWITPDRQYAEGYATKDGRAAKVWYVDIPEGSEHLKKAFDDEGTGQQAPHVAFEAPEEIAKGLRELPSDGRSPLEHWMATPLEDQRDAHEKFARGFETYLMEGKAPTQEMQSLFSRFRAWLINIYRSLGSLRAELTPEVRQVFDRLMASDDAIRETEQLRGYAPLDLNATGATPEQRAEYAGLGQQATQDALDAMQASSLRDMKWLSKARSTAFRRIQREAAEARGMVRAEAEKEVRATPVEQAREFIKEANLDLNPERRDYQQALHQWEANRVESADAARQAWEQANPEPSVAPHVSGKKPSAVDRARYNEQRAEWAAQREAAAGAHAEQWARQNPKPEKPLTTADLWVRERAAMEKDVATQVKAEYLDRPEAENLSGIQKGKYLARVKRAMANEVERRMLEWEGRHPRPDSSATRISPDLVAEQFGFGSGKELMAALREATPEQKIDSLTDQRMLERHGDLVNPDAVEQAANEAVHNEARARFMATGLKLLTESRVSARDLAKAATVAAGREIAGKQIRELNPRQFEVAESKANREALQAAPKDVAAAASAQRRALLANRLAKAARDAVTEVKKIVASQARYDKASVRSRMDPDILEQIDALRERFDFRQHPPEGPTKQQVALRAWAETQKSFGYVPVQHPDMMDPAVRMPYRDMTVEQLRGFHDTIRSMEQIGRSRKSVMVAGKRMDVAEIVGQLVEKMKERGEQFSLEQLVEPPRRGVDPLFRVALDRMSSWLRAVAAEAKPQQFKANQFDQHELLGPFSRAIFDRVFNANYEKIGLLKATADLFGEGVEALGKEWQGSLNDLIENRHLLDADLTAERGEAVYRKLTRGDMLGIARHVGNESNFDKLTKGMGWAPQDVWAFLNEHMSDKDWKATQLTWDAFDMHWPLMAAMNERLGNVSPDRIEPRAFRTASGLDLAGGYAPIDYDPLRSKLAVRKSDASAIDPADGLYGRGYFFADTTTNGSLNSRVANYYDRIDLGYHSLERRLHDTIHDTSYREALLDVHKIISDAGFRRQFQMTYGSEQYKAMQQWVGDIANGQNTDAQLSRLSQLMQSARHTLMANAIALRVSTMVKHGGSALAKSSGYFSGGGGKYFAAAVAQMATNHAGMIDTALHKFPEIRARALQQDRDYRQTTASLFQPESFHSKAERFGHSAVAYLDLLSAVPTAWAAYNRAITEGIPVDRGGTGEPMNEQDAIEYANQIVREAHGSNIESARSLLLQSRNEMLKVMTTLYGFMNNSLGQSLDMADKFRTAGFSKPEVLSRFLMAMILPGLVAGVVEKPDKDEGWAEWAGKAIAGEVAGMVPLLRDAVSLLRGYPSAGVAPLMQVMKALAKPIIDVRDAAEGKPVKAPIKDLGNAIGLGIPGLGQLGTTAQYVADVHSGKQRPEGVADIARGLAFGQGNK